MNADYLLNFINSRLNSQQMHLILKGMKIDNTIPLEANFCLMTPGPVPIHPEVLKIMALPAIHHRTPEFESIFARVRSNLKKVFKTSENVFVHTSTGSGAMESALVNTLSPGDKIICIVSGKFGERWAEMAKAYQIQVIEHKVEWGQRVEVSEIQNLLLQHPDCKAVLCQACETSTGVLHPIYELAQILKSHTSILIVDGITALGATHLPMDEWGIDVLIGGSQKAFMLPTGLSFISFSKKAWALVEQAKCPRFYFDIRKELKANLSGESFFSTAVTHFRALDYILENHMASNLDGILNRIHSLALCTREAAALMGLEIYTKYYSPSLSVIRMPEGIDGQKVRQIMESKYRVTVMGGQDQLKGKIIRIGHMGYIQNNDVLTCMKALADSINELKPNQVSELQKEQAIKYIQVNLK